MNDDNMMFDYLLQMGAMRPEQEELRKRQAMVDVLQGRLLVEHPPGAIDHGPQAGDSSVRSVVSHHLG